MKKSSSQLAVLAHEDLKRLQSSPVFRTAIKKLHASIEKKLSSIDLYKEAVALGERFGILDSEWLLDVAKEWDRKGPLPIPSGPWYKRPSMLAFVKGEGAQPQNEHKFIESMSSKYYDPEFAGSEVRTVPGSPKIWYRRSVLTDEDGVRYLTFTVRLTPDLSAKTLKSFASESLEWAEQDPARGKRKPTLFIIASDILNAAGSKKRWSVNRWAGWLRQEMQEKHNCSLSMTSAKRYIRRHQST